MKSYFEWQKKTHFVFPIDGDCVNQYDGEIRGGKLYIKAVVVSDCDVKINGIDAVKCADQNHYTAEICVEEGKNVLVAESASDTHTIEVYRLKNCTGLYRLSSDDNIIFFWDLNKNKDKYTSIFDNPYLAVYKKAHDLYGACVHLNIYYEMPEVHPFFSDTREYFNLSMMTDKYKSEWQANSDWLKLNFHAKADQPDKPYKYTDYDTIYNDCKKVQEEIIRFAGKETLSEETTVHWGESTKEGVVAVRDLGIKNLAGYFELSGGRQLVSYYYPKDLVEYLMMRDFWYDKEVDVLYCKIDKVLNIHTPEENVNLLNVLYERKTTAGFVEIMIHEEYFYPDHRMYEADFADRVLEPCKWLAEKGYKSAFINDVSMM